MLILNLKRKKLGVLFRAGFGYAFSLGNESLILTLPILWGSICWSARVRNIYSKIPTIGTNVHHPNFTIYLNDFNLIGLFKACMV